MNRHIPLNMAANQAAAVASQISLDELREATRRLTELLMEEADLLAAMRVADVLPLQQEKLQLTRTLEMAQAQLAAKSAFMQSASPEEREELLLMTDDLAYAVEHNHRQASAARTVNARVMQAIMDVATEQHRPASYDRLGQVSGREKLTLSLKLNQQA